MDYNKALLASSGEFDSAKLDQHVDIIKQITESGTYRCEIAKNSSYFTTIVISVSNSNDPGQINVDLSDSTIGHSAPKCIKLRTDDFIVFYSGWGGDKFEIVMAGETGIVMDSTSLSNDEILVITPFTPGTYDFFDSGSGASGTLTVERLPKLDDIAMQHERTTIFAAGAVTVEIDHGKFVPNSVVLRGDQPMVIKVKTETQIFSTLKQPNSSSAP